MAVVDQVVGQGLEAYVDGVWSRLAGGEAFGEECALAAPSEVAESLQVECGAEVGGGYEGVKVSAVGMVFVVGYAAVPGRGDQQGAG
ncbi:hypothetical protein GCM10010112_90820 [Actinoplanes lobatus]|uniref:Uncharacterized protein n=1 Tax=Actinoplanes lobatus TaxID=113568 RepID=A0ABQ4AXX1_9ACTN|nr:hypothetical protein GCM10010112_90820 [Actinoplanes lobatus]GIE45867.1 hypothetical protein Alo02nite_87650 [Actinoplanes lobatus]